MTRKVVFYFTATKDTFVHNSNVSNILFKRLSILRNSFRMRITLCIVNNAEPQTLFRGKILECYFYKEKYFIRKEAFVFLIEDLCL